MGWLWILVTGLGVVMLGAAIFYATRLNKHDSAGHVAEAERGAKALRDELADDEAQRGE